MRPRRLRLPEAAKPAVRTFVGVGALAGIGLWALHPLVAQGGDAAPPQASLTRARDVLGRATLVAALTVAFAAPEPLGNATVVLLQRFVGGLVGSAVAAGLLAIRPAALGARLAAAGTPLIAWGAVRAGQDCGVQYGAQFCVLSFILVAVEGASRGGAADAGWLALARGGGVLVGSVASAILGVCVCPQAASNAVTARLGDALGGVVDLVQAATGERVEEKAETPAPRWWRRLPFLRSSSPLAAATDAGARAGSAALTTADLVGATGPAALAALDAAVGPEPPLLPAALTTPPTLDACVARAAARVGAALGALEAAAPWTRAEVCAWAPTRGGPSPPWARVWLPGLASARALKSNPAARARRLPGIDPTPLRTAASTLVLASNARGRALSGAALESVAAFWRFAATKAALAEGPGAADPLAAVAGPAAAAWAALRGAWERGEGLERGDPAGLALEAAEATARDAVRALLVEARSGAGAVPTFLAGLTAEEASGARALIRARLALAGLGVSDFQGAVEMVGGVVAGLPGGFFSGR